MWGFESPLSHRRLLHQEPLFLPGSSDVGEAASSLQTCLYGDSKKCMHISWSFTPGLVQAGRHAKSSDRTHPHPHFSIRARSGVPGRDHSCRNRSSAAGSHQAPNSAHADCYGGQAIDTELTPASRVTLAGISQLVGPVTVASVVPAPISALRKSTLPSTWLTAPETIPVPSGV